MPIWRRSRRAAMAAGYSFSDVLFDRSRAARIAQILGKRCFTSEIATPEPQEEDDDDDDEAVPDTNEQSPEPVTQELVEGSAKRERRRRKCEITGCLQTSLCLLSVMMIVYFL